MEAIYDLRTFEPRKGVGHLVKRVHGELMDAIDQGLAADENLASLEITSAQFVILASLCLHGASSASALCKSVLYDAGAMTRMIDRLETKGLIRRCRSCEDRRLVNLEVTEEGMAAFPRMLAVSTAVLNRLLHG